MSPRTILVAHDGGPGTRAVLELACDIVKARGGRVVVLAVTELHLALPLYNLPGHFDEPGWNALVHAEGLAKGWDMEIEARLRRSHDAARTIVGEAWALRADSIFLALKPPRFSWLPHRLGKHARAVMRNAPCPVLVGHVPVGGELNAAGALAEAEQDLRHNVS
jgi:nucleotide-binding universal stress UspA family protein